MDSKYYTPEIEEFHVGFEYEYHNILGPKKGWIKQIITNPGTIWNIPGLKASLAIRVKYLDQEDIEELGWMPLQGYSAWYWDFTDSANLRITLHEKDDEYNYNITIMEYDYYLFQGTIKNKSELKKLMKQLNITK